MTRLLLWLLNKLPHDTLMIDGRPYMHRWYLGGYAPASSDPTVADADGHRPARTSWWWRWGFGAIRLHQILADDDSRAFHDHPWDFLSIGLHGTYTELTPCQLDHTLKHQRLSRPEDVCARRRTYRAPWLIWRRAEDLHCLTGIDRPVWTLIVMGRKRRTWGFLDTDGWVGWREYDKRHPERNAWTEEKVLYQLQARDRLAGARSCQRCGCTDRYACPGGCTWAETPVRGPDGLCSRCA